MLGISIIPPNEEERVKNLNDYKILHNKSEPIFDQLAATAAKMLNTPLAMINFVDNYRVWTLTEQNENSAAETDNGMSIFSLAIQKDSVSIFEDITKEPLLISNPLIAGEFGFRFYAAAPITTNEGFVVGIVCVVDRTSRTFNLSEQRKLDWVATMVRIEMNKRIAVHAVA